MFTIYKSLIYNYKYHHPSHIYSDFEGTRGAPLDIVDRYIHPPSHIKRNLDFSSRSFISRDPMRA